MRSTELSRPPVKGGASRRRAGGFAADSNSALRDWTHLANPGFFRRPPSKMRGFTYIGILIIVAITGAGLAATGTFFSQTAQREKERELLFVGDQYRQAIASYYNKTPGGAKAYPKKLDDLLEDKRFPMPQRHLRKLYADPITGSNEWAIVEVPGGAGIMGVHSRSEEAPIKSANFRARDAAFEGAARYADWQFVYAPATAPKAPEAPKPAGK